MAENFPEKVREFTINKFEYYLNEYNLDNVNDISEELELGIFDYAIEKGNNSLVQIMNYYKLFYITIITALKKDQVIQKLRDKEWEPVDVITYSREQIYPEKWSAIQKEIDSEKSTGPKKKGQHRCTRCKSWYTTYVEVQTRSADESATIKCECSECGHVWKFG